MVHRNIQGLALSLFLSWIGAVSASAQEALSLQIIYGATGERVELDLSGLDALPQTEFTTTTIWTDGDVVFSGVALKQLLDTVGAAGRQIEMVALNDYNVTMPFANLEDAAPIVATRMNGAPMSVRDKGPFWVVFPYDSHRKYRTEPIYALSIWQLTRLKVVD